MPPRPKHNKRRAVAAPDDWFELFQMGFDGFGDLKYAGISLDENDRPDRELTLDAWKRYGEAFLADYAAEHPNGPSKYGIWALDEFGPPR